MNYIMISVFVLLTCMAHVVAMDKHSIVVLNGSSCAGKSSIASYLREKMESNFIVISYDEFRKDFFTQHHKTLQLLPDDYNYTEVTVFFDDVKKHLSLLNEQEKPAKEVEVGSFYRTANMEFYKHIQRSAQTRPVIVDTIILSEQQKDMMKKQLDQNVIMVFVHVPFAAIAERIIKRNVVSKGQARYANRVLSIYPDFYSVNKGENENFKGHISRQEIETAVEQSLSLPHSTEFPTGRILAEKIIEKFGLQDSINQQTMQLIPRLSHDYIVDTTVETPEQCALRLCHELKN